MSVSTVLILTKYSSKGASSRIRFLQFLPYLNSLGTLSFEVSTLISDSQLEYRYNRGSYLIPSLIYSYLRRIVILLRASKSKLLFIEKEALPFLPYFVEKLLLYRKKYILDYDDATFHQYESISSRLLRRLLIGKIPSLMRNSSLIIAGNEYLKNYALNSGATRVSVIPSVVDTTRYYQSTSIPDTPLRIVWIGSPSTAKYLQPLSKPLATLAESIDLQLLVIGGNVSLPNVQTETHPWSQDTESNLISSCHIGIMPLPDLPFERGKCGFKLLQYMACGLPVIASPVGVNTKIVSHGVNGFLASSDNDWYRYLLLLAQNPDLRVKLGNYSLARVNKYYSINSSFVQLNDLLLSVR